MLTRQNPANLLSKLTDYSLKIDNKLTKNYFGRCNGVQWELGLSARPFQEKLRPTSTVATTTTVIFQYSEISMTLIRQELNISSSKVKYVSTWKTKLLWIPCFLNSFTATVGPTSCLLQSFLSNTKFQICSVEKE
jgi:hypothetical protein